MLRISIINTVAQDAHLSLCSEGSILFFSSIFSASKTSMRYIVGIIIIGVIVIVFLVGYQVCSYSGSYSGWDPI